MNDIVLVELITKGADNFNINLGDFVRSELGIFKRLVDY